MSDDHFLKNLLRKAIELKNMKMKLISKYYLIIYKILQYKKLKLTI